MPALGRQRKQRYVTPRRRLDWPVPKRSQGRESLFDRARTKSPEPFPPELIRGNIESSAYAYNIELNTIPVANQSRDEQNQEHDYEPLS